MLYGHVNLGNGRKVPQLYYQNKAKLVDCLYNLFGIKKTDLNINKYGRLYAMCQNLVVYIII